MWAGCPGEKEAHESYLYRIRCPWLGAAALFGEVVREFGKMDL